MAVAHRKMLTGCSTAGGIAPRPTDQDAPLPPFRAFDQYSSTRGFGQRIPFRDQLPYLGMRLVDICRVVFIPVQPQDRQ